MISDANVAENLKIANLMMEYVREIEKSIRDLYKLIDMLARGDYEGDDVYSEIESQVEKIDRVKDGIVEYIAKSSPVILEKDNWMRLIINLESVSDYAEGAATNIMVLMKRMKGEALPKEISEEMVKLVTKSIETYEALKDVIMVLSKRPHMVLTNYRVVEEKEREVDYVQRRLNVLIAESTLPLPMILLLRDIVSQIEEMTDAMEKAMDEARVVAIQIS